jgi:nitrite reductase/ring-hydroxylating ferredoxin subunit
VTRIGKPDDLPVGSVTAVGDYVVGNNGEYFALSRRCRHLGADLADGSVDDDGCLVCPWHGAKYDVRTGRMVRGPQGAFARVPGLSTAFRALTQVAPLRRARVVVRDGELYLAESEAEVDP